MTFKNIFFISLFLIFSISISALAQTPFQIDQKKDNVLIAGGFGLTIIGFYLERKISPMTDNEINNLSKNNVNSFDRSALSNWSPGLSKASDVLLIGFGVMPGVLLLSDKIRKDFYTIAVLYIETISFTTGAIYLSKGLVKRARPFSYNSDVSVSEKTDADTRKSFFSGHTALAFASTVFSAKVFGDYYPESKWRKPVWSLALFGAATAGYFRYESGQHFPSDILAGALVGSLAGYIIPQIHKKKSNVAISFSPRQVNNYYTLNLNIRF